MEPLTDEYYVFVLQNPLTKEYFITEPLTEEYLNYRYETPYRIIFVLPYHYGTSYRRILLFMETLVGENI